MNDWGQSPSFAASAETNSVGRRWMSMSIQGVGGRSGYEGEVLDRCGLIKLDLRLGFAVVVSGAQWNPCGHVLLYEHVLHLCRHRAVIDGAQPDAHADVLWVRRFVDDVDLRHEGVVEREMDHPQLLDRTGVAVYRLQVAPEERT